MSKIRLYGETSGYVELQAPDVANDVTITLPNATGAFATEPYVDAAVAAGVATVPASGTVFITNVSVSAVSKISLDSIFTSAHDGYHIITSLTGSASAGLTFRFRASGSDDSSAQYNMQRIQAQGTTLTTLRDQNVTSLGVGGVYSITRQVSEIIAFSPNLGSRTTGYIRGMQDGGNGIFGNPMQGMFDIATGTVYDGVSFIPGSGTVTGNVYVYGFRK